MSSPHQEGKIPWSCLTEHVKLDRYPRTPHAGDFKLRRKSDPTARKKAFIHFSRVLASRIVEFAESQRSALPKPNASVEEWRDAGVIDDALFPRQFLRDLKEPHRGDLDHELLLKREEWEKIDHESHSEAAVALAAMTEPSKPFLYLPSLLYLARHPRVPLSLLQSIYTSGNYHAGEPGILHYMDSTTRRYIYLNLILALDSGEAFDDGGELQYRLNIQCGNHYFRSETLHRSFWGPPFTITEAQRDPQARARYSVRCFQALVAWYAVMSEAYARDLAVGYTKREPFNKESLEMVIISQLQRISPVLRVLPMDFDWHISAQSEVSLIPPKPDDSTPSKGAGRRSKPSNKHAARPQGAFLYLPNEIHFHIYSFLPPAFLHDVSLVCKRMRAISVEMIHKDPFALRSRVVDDASEFRRFASTLNDHLNRHSHLAGKLRCFHLSTRDIDKHLRTSPVASQPPFCWSSAQELDELWLHLPARTQRGTFHVPPPTFVEDISQLCPNISSLHLRNLPGDIEHHHGTSVPPTSDSYVPKTFRALKRLSFRFLDSGLNDIGLYMRLVGCSSASLHTLELTLLGDEFTHGAPTMPVCPQVENLTLRMRLSSSEIEYILQRSFPAVKVLHLEADESGVDFSTAAPQLQHLYLSYYTTAHLPPSLQTFSFCFPYSDPIGITGNNSSVQAVFLDMAPHDLEVCIPALGTTFPFLTSLELVQNNHNITEEKLNAIAMIVAQSHLHLEILVMNVHYLSHRPQRIDYPIEDALDEAQQAQAIHFFTLCTHLKVISFCSIPPETDPVPVCQVPGRVWVRTAEDGTVSARMSSAGRANLKWKLSEFWSQH